jgi:Flp pilus assembly pilin Flp
MRSTIKYGLITGLISIIFLFGSFTLFAWLKGKLGWDMQMATVRGIGGLLSIPIQAIGIYMAMQNVKKVTGALTYSQALKTGITVAITIALLLGLFSFIYCQFLNPGYADYMVHDARQAMIAQGDSQQDISKKSVEVAQEFATGTQIMEALVGQFVTGTIVSLIIGLFIKTKTTP